jgi:hypothetical protein
MKRCVTLIWVGIDRLTQSSDVPVGAELARDKAGCDGPVIFGVLIAGKLRSHRIEVRQFTTESPSSTTLSAAP